MPFTIMKSATAAHAMALGAEQHEVDEPDSQMATGADKPVRSDEVDDQDEAVKASQRHPLTGQFTSDQIPSGATHGPLAQAMAMHRPAQPLADLATVPGPAGGALASSITANPGAVNVTHLDYRQGSGPVATAVSPIRPADHTAPNGPRQ